MYSQFNIYIYIYVLLIYYYIIMACSISNSANMYHNVYASLYA